MIPIPSPAFFAIALVLVIAPGPDFAMTTRNILRGGRSAGILTGLGVASGSLVWTICAVFGILALLQLSSVAFTIIRVAGALFLIWLGVRSLLAALNRGQAVGRGTLPNTLPVVTGSEPQSAARSKLLRPFRDGLLCNLLNPKAAAIYSSVLPQFVSRHNAAGPQLAVEGAVFVLLIALWLPLYSLLASGVLAAANIKARRVIAGVTGLVLLVFGVRLATE